MVFTAHSGHNKSNLESIDISIVTKSGQNLLLSATEGKQYSTCDDYAENRFEYL